MTTTHPSANDSGLNLDHLEALARAATAGPWLHRRDPGNPIGAQHCVKLAGEQGAWVCDCIDNADRSTIGGIAGERNAGFIAAANPSAVLELIALARRAAPVSAPTVGGALASTDADHLRRKFISIITGATSLGEQRVWDLALVLMAEARAALAIQPAPTVPAGDALTVPRELLARCLTSMKHAVSFGETGRGRPPQQTCMFEIEELTAALAHQPAQEQAEPLAWRFREYDDQEKCHRRTWFITMDRGAMEIYKRYDAIIEPLYAHPAPAQAAQQEPVAAPQQAAAPGEQLWLATLRACGELPAGYEVRIELENGCGMAVWYDAEGERHVIDGDGYLSDDVNEAVDAAIQRAAAPKGGAA